MGVVAGEPAVVEVAWLVVATAVPLGDAVALVAEGAAVVAAAEGTTALVDGADVSVVDEPPPPHAEAINSTARLNSSTGVGCRENNEDERVDMSERFMRSPFPKGVETGSTVLACSSTDGDAAEMPMRPRRREGPVAGRTCDVRAAPPDERELPYATRLARIPPSLTAALVVR